MEISTVIGTLALLIAVYGVYRLMTSKSDTFMAAHNDTHDEMIEMFAECEMYAQFLLQHVEGIGYVMTKPGRLALRSDKVNLIGLLRQADQAISDELRIDWMDVWRFKLSDLMQVAAHHKQWRVGHLRIKSQLAVMQEQSNPIYVVR